ncbi:hypothetical protein [Mycoplasma hafezii]|uniref:hypothetical protein n=1 Tax=Mycoplasma hafezii TaxID=525886 RepID=UPI003CF88555
MKLLWKVDKKSTLTMLFFVLLSTILASAETLFFAYLMQLFSSVADKLSLIYQVFGYILAISFLLLLVKISNEFLERFFLVKAQKHIQNTLTISLLNQKLSVLNEVEQDKEFYLLTTAIEQYCNQYLLLSFTLLNKLFSTLAILITIAVLSPITLSYTLPLLFILAFLPLLSGGLQQAVGSITNTLFQEPVTKNMQYLNALYTQSINGN